MKKLFVLFAVGTLIVSCKSKDAECHNETENVTEVDAVEVSDEVQEIQQTTDSLHSEVQSVEEGVDNILEELK